MLIDDPSSTVASAPPTGPHIEVVVGDVWDRCAHGWEIARSLRVAPAAFAVLAAQSRPAPTAAGRCFAK